MTILATQSDSVRAGSGTWQQHMKWAVRDLDSLLERLNLPPDLNLGADAVRQFPVFVPLPLLGRMIPGDVNDPLLRQVLPVRSEDQSPSRFSLDPLGESQATRTPGLLQKYAGRVLLVTTGACAVHCRYCFRRHFAYDAAPTSFAQWEPAITQIAADESIEEVILSGGDPLTIVDSQLGALVARLKQIRHLRRLRIHTRLPIMIPQRVTKQLVEIFDQSQLQIIVVIHANHANELDEAVASALRMFLKVGAILLNQTVLLRGINDEANPLIGLSKRLLECRVLPYYLHQLDPVIGTSHFEVPQDRGLALIEQMRTALPGYAVPRYVKEFEGEPSKTVWS